MRARQLVFGVVGVVASALLLGMAAHKAAAPVALQSLSASVDNALMAKYEAKQRAQDEDTMKGAFEMNKKWGGTFSNGVGSNTWKGTPWAKYDDAVAQRQGGIKHQMLSQVPAASKAPHVDPSMSKYDAMHPSENQILARQEKEDAKRHAQLAKAGMTEEDMDGLDRANEMHEEEAAFEARHPEEMEGKEKEGEEGEEANAAVGEGGSRAATVDKEMLEDHEEADGEDAKPEAISLSQSIAECEKSCDGDKPCEQECKTVMDLPKDAPPAGKVLAEAGSKGRVRGTKEKWQKQQEAIIAKCTAACSSDACKQSCNDPANVPAPAPEADSFEAEDGEEGAEESDLAPTEDLYEYASRGADKPATKRRATHNHAARKVKEPKFLTSQAYSSADDASMSATAIPTAQKMAYWEGLGDEKDRSMSVGRSIKAPMMPNKPPTAAMRQAQGTTMLAQTSADANAQPYYGAALGARPQGGGGGNGGNPYAAGWSKVQGTNLDQVYKGINEQLQPLAQAYPYLRSVRH